MLKEVIFTSEVLVSCSQLCSLLWSEAELLFLLLFLEPESLWSANEWGEVLSKCKSTIYENLY